MTTGKTEAREYRVKLEEGGLRLDRFLAGRMKMPEWSRSQLQNLIRKGRVEVERMPPKKSGQVVLEGQTVRVKLVRESTKAYPENLPLDLLYEDMEMAVVNKSAGMVVHAGAGTKSGTLVNALLYHLGHLSRSSEGLRPGIVHRLDKMSSGVIVVAKTELAHRRLAEQFKSRSVTKVYKALVHGRIAETRGEIGLSVGRDRRQRIRMCVGGIASRTARTKFEIVHRYEGFTLLRVEPQTGRTHQIRVHFSSRGRPVVGDILYGAPSKIRLGGFWSSTLSRNFLHAEELHLTHPVTKERLSFYAPLPGELEKFLGQLDSRTL